MKEGSNYTNSIKLPFQVVKEGSYLAVFAKPNPLEYEPKEQTVTLTARKGEEDVTEKATFKVIRYTSAGQEEVKVTGNTFQATDAGTYVVTAEYTSGTGAGATVAYGSTTVVVNPKKIDSKDVTVSDIPQQDYTGDAVVPEELTIQDNETPLNEGTDYTVSITNNVAPNSDAKVTITGIGNYTATRDVIFKIGPMQYTLQYNPNGGNTESLPADAHSKDTFSVASGSGMTHDAAQIDSKDYPVLFVGWSQENDNRKIYKKGDNLPEMIYAGQTLTPTNPLTTLYAIWGYDTDGDGRADVVQSTVRVVYDKGIGTTGTPPRTIRPISSAQWLRRWAMGA